MKRFIPFNKPLICEKSFQYLKESYSSGIHSGNKYWANKSINYMKNKYKLGETFLVPSGTSALEMGALLLDIKHGDEVIMPSYTFSSTANSILNFGAKPVFCEINSKTLNINPEKIESLINEKTKLIIPIDYAGVPCEIEKIKFIAKKYSLPVMVDSAQSFGSKINEEEWSGSQADLVTFSFHETKNISCGEGGALIVNDENLIEKAFLIQEKGTDRKNFLMGEKSKYSWCEKGSSFLLSDLLAAILFGQLENDDYIKLSRAKVTNLYLKISKKYKNYFSTIAEKDIHKYNHHGFYFLFKNESKRNKFILNLKSNYNINSYSHYSPLHSSPMGKKLGYLKNDLKVTEKCSKNIARLPIYPDLGRNKNDLLYLEDSIEKTINDIF